MSRGWKPSVSQASAVCTLDNGLTFHVEKYNDPILMAYFSNEGVIIPFPSEAHLVAYGDTEASTFIKKNNETCCPIVVSTSYDFLWNNVHILTLERPTQHNIKYPIPQHV